jgi:hypothetical protein
MAGSRRHIKLEESQYIRDIALIMAKGTGPFTRKMLSEALSKIHPTLSIQELRNKVSGAIQDDKYINKRFKVAKPGWWDLAERS